MKTIKPPQDFHAGIDAANFRTMLNRELAINDVALDLSDVIFMDSFTFRIVFDFLPRLSQVIPPKSTYVIERYNDWLDGKKGLSK